MEYYGYKDRGEAGNPIVDWGKIASDLTEKLTTVEAGREAKRKEIDDVTQGFVNEINAVDAGHSQSMGTFIQDAANSTKQYTLMQQKLLKQGKIDPNQYKMNLQNQKDSWTSFTGVAKNWNANYDRFVDLQAKGLVGQQAADLMEQLGSMQNFQNKKAFIDPASGNLYAAEYDSSGNIDTTKFRPQSATTLLKMMGDTPLKVNVTAEVAKNNKIADFKRVTGGMNISDPTARPGYKELSSGIANSVLSTDRAIGSVLMDTVGGYKATFQTDPSKYTDQEKELSKAGKLITYKLDGTGNYNPADFTPAQMAEAKKAVEDNLRSQLGYEAEPVKVSGGGGGEEGPTWAQRQKLLDNTPKFAGVQNLVKRGKVIGKVIGIKDAKTIIAPGVTEQINAIGLEDGKLTMKVTTYKGSATTKDGEEYSETNKTATPTILYEDKNAASLDSKLRSIGINSIEEAKSRFGGVATTSTKTEMVTMVMPNGQTGQIPSNKVNAFLKKYPKAKQQ